ncbi:MAG: heme-copper oxidase subunit III [Planctomycetota bacterium]
MKVSNYEIESRAKPPLDTQSHNGFNNGEEHHGLGRAILIFFLAMVTMLFAGFTSAYVIRSSAIDWKPIPMPGIVWFNSIILILSSFTFEITSRLYRKGIFSRWPVILTLFFGIVFFIGQIILYKKLMAMGIYVATNPHSSFLYILSALHIIHFSAGIIWLLILVINSLKDYKAISSNALFNCRIYWHYFTILWLYLVFLLFIFKISIEIF